MNGACLRLLTRPPHWGSSWELLQKVLEKLVQKVEDEKCVAGKDGDICLWCQKEGAARLQAEALRTKTGTAVSLRVRGQNVYYCTFWSTCKSHLVGL